MKKFYRLTLSATLAILAAGCATSSAPSASDESLPRVEGIRTITSDNEIGLEWPRYDSNTAVLGFVVYRAPASGGEAKKIATIADPYSTHYVDTRLQPGTSYKYTVRTYGAKGVSAPSPVAIASTAKMLESVPFAQAIYGLPGRVKIIWRPHPDLRVSSYLIERRPKGGESWSTIKEVRGRLSAEYIDYVDYGEGYEYRIVVKTGKGELSKPSAVIATAQAE